MSQCCNYAVGDRHTKTVAGLLERPRYSPGLILQDADLTSAVDYTRELSRLLFRSLFGCGVVCGLRVTVDTDCDLEVTVASGLALDGCGDPVQLTSPVTTTLGERDGVPRKGPPKTTDFWVILCGKDKYCAPRSIVCEAEEQDGTTQMTRVRAQAVVSVVSTPPACVCGQVVPEADRLTKARVMANPAWTPGEEKAVSDCPKDCGCADPCGCGCCVLLAWVHWFEPNADQKDGVWRVLQKGIRRFVRPQMLEDPDANEAPGPAPVPKPEVPAGSPAAPKPAPKPAPGAGKP